MAEQQPPEQPHPAAPPRSATWLLDHRRDVHSQTGEDGVIEAILATLPATDGWCVEFGAWDGRYLTNTRQLIEARDYRAVLIEADAAKFRELERNYADRPRVHTLHRTVGFGADDNLDRILAATPTPRDFDLLSIDIDGNDYHVWAAIEDYRPKVVVIEFNPTIPTEVDFVQPADPDLSQGASLRALVALAQGKGYELVAVLPFNAFFVRRELYPAFGLPTNAPEVLRTDLSAVTYLFCGFDGRVFLRGNRRLPWHNLDYDEAKVQQLPAVLRTYPGRYTPLQRWLAKVHRRLRALGRRLRLRR